MIADSNPKPKHLSKVPIKPRGLIADYSEYEQIRNLLFNVHFKYVGTTFSFYTCRLKNDGNCNPLQLMGTKLHMIVSGAARDREGLRPLKIVQSPAIGRAI